MGGPRDYHVCLVVQSCPTLRHHGLQPTRLLCPWGFSRQEYWSGLPYLRPGDLPDLGIEPRSPALQADSLPSDPPGELPIKKKRERDILKSRDITLPTKVHLVKAMVFPMVMYGYYTWTIKKAEHLRLMLLNCGVGQDS